MTGPISANMAPVLIAVVLAAAASLFALAFSGYRAAGLRRRMDDRLGRVCGRADPGPAAGHGGALSSLVSQLGERVAKSALVGHSEAARMGPRLAAAGFDHPRALQAFIGIKSLMALLALAAGYSWLQSQYPSPGAAMHLGVCIGAALAGWRLPDLVVSQRRKSRLEAIERGLPDALDLLVICGEAGLGFDVAVGRVAREIVQSHPEMGKEFTKLAAEMRVLPDRTQALTNMADRLQLDSVRSFTGMLAQSMRYGTPLSQALRVVSAELRAERMVRFEARAAKLSVLITLPMILFILPCVFIVVGGPAVIDAVGMLSNGPTSGGAP